MRFADSLRWVALAAIGCTVGCAAKDDVVSEGAIRCELRFQLIRAKRPQNLAKLFENCEVPLSNPPQLPYEILRAVFRNTEPVDCMQFPDAVYGVSEPTADGSKPSTPKSIVFCPEVCELYKAWVTSETADDICNLNEANQAATGSTVGSSNDSITGAAWPTAGNRGFPVTHAGAGAAGAAGVPAEDDVDSGTAGSAAAAPAAGSGGPPGAGAAGSGP